MEKILSNTIFPGSSASLALLLVNRLISATAGAIESVKMCDGGSEFGLGVSSAPGDTDGKLGISGSLNFSKKRFLFFSNNIQNTSDFACSSGSFSAKNCNNLNSDWLAGRPVFGEKNNAGTAASETIFDVNSENEIFEFCVKSKTSISMLGTLGSTRFITDETNIDLTNSTAGNASIVFRYL